MKLIYLASPYTHKDPKIMQERHDAVLAKTIELMQQGYHVFSPIVYSHPIAVDKAWNSAAAGQAVFNTWAEFDLDILERCDAMWILMLDGWGDSNGVTGELLFAKVRDKEIRYISPREG